MTATAGARKRDGSAGVSPSTSPQLAPEPHDDRPGRRWYERPFRSVRARVLLSYVVLLSFSSLLTSLLTPELLSASLRQRVEASLAQEVLELERLLDDGRDPSTGQPFAALTAFFNVYLDRNVPNLSEAVLTYVEGETYRSLMTRYPLDDLGVEGPPPWAALASSANPSDELAGTYSTESGRGYFIAHPVDVGGTSGLFVIVDLPAAEQRFIDAFRTYGLIASLAVLLISTAVAWPVAGRALKPIRQVAETAKAITSSDLNRRVEVDTVGDAADMASSFNAMLDRLQAVLDSQREFMRVAGHELRDPVTIGLGHLELLRSGTDDPAAKATLELVLDELTRMGRIVTDLQVLAADQQQDFLRPESVDLTTLTHELIAKASQMAPERVWKLDASADGEVQADRHRITEAVMNLVHNSVNATAPRDTIAIGTARSGYEWTLWVRDTGVGTEPDPELFEPGNRGTDARHRYRGSGLGLATVRLVAEAHAGTVNLRSTPGEGTTVTLTLPTEAAPRPFAQRGAR
jgi:signal transduction histidine kinase